jgi:excisionase family DNA binding protein
MASNPVQPPAPIRPLPVNSAGDIPTLALRPREAAKALGIGARKLWELTNIGAVPHVRLGRAIVYPVSLLEKWLAEQANGGTRP